MTKTTNRKKNTLMRICIGIILVSAALLTCAYFQAHLFLTDRYSWYTHMSLLYQKNDLSWKSLDYASKAISLDSARPEAYILRGQAYYSQGSLDIAKKSYETARKKQPEILVFYQMGMLLLQQGKTAESITEFAHGTLAEEQPVRDYAGLALAYLCKAENEIALGFALNASNLLPEVPERRLAAFVYATLGICYENAGNGTQANHFYRLSEINYQNVISGIRSKLADCAVNSIQRI
ncbi:MAG: hypothetical protein ABIF10_01420 [Candidatus Woesearchaeota archaeon]